MKTMLSVAHVALTGRAAALYHGRPPALKASPIALPDEVTGRMQKLQQLVGYEPVLVGGTISRLQLGKPLNDLDFIILTPNSPRTAAKAFRRQLDDKGIPHFKGRFQWLIFSHVGLDIDGIQTDVLFLKGTRERDLARIAETSDMDMAAGVISRDILYEAPRRVKALTEKTMRIGPMGLYNYYYARKRIKHYRETYPELPVSFARRRDAFLLQTLPDLWNSLRRPQARPPESAHLAR